MPCAPGKRPSSGTHDIQATARGTSIQLGRMFNINVHIESFSPDEDRETIIVAFARSSYDGVVGALEHMKAEGRIGPLGRW